MADGPEADVDEPPSIHFPPLITVTDLPGATAAGNHLSMHMLRPCPYVCSAKQINTVVLLLLLLLFKGLMCIKVWSVDPGNRAELYGSDAPLYALS